MPRRPDLQQRQRLLDELRTSCSDGELAAGQLLPPTRELAARYKVSQNTIAEIIQQLTSEGVLYTTPRVGTFVGKPQATQNGVFMMLMPYAPKPELPLARIRTGFEMSIAQMGGTLWMPKVLDCLELLKQDNAPNVAGLFLPDRLHYAEEVERVTALIRARATGHLPTVRFGQPSDDADTLNFDDVDGGIQATEYLLRQGHRKIAYLGLHPPEGSQTFNWSRHRESGWQSSLRKAGLDATNLSFIPPYEAALDAENTAVMEVARIAAAPLVELCRRGEITAVVVANCYAVQSLLQVLSSARINPEKWPQLVSFDDAAYTDSHVISSLALPWEELGSRAAQLLWDGVASGKPRPARVELLKLRLIPRFSHHTIWLNNAFLANNPLILPAPAGAS